MKHSSGAPEFVDKVKASHAKLPTQATAPSSTASPSSSVDTEASSVMFDHSRTVNDSETDIDDDEMDQSDESSDGEETGPGEPRLETTFRTFSQHLTSFLALELDLAARLIPRMQSHLFNNPGEQYRNHGSSGGPSSSTPSNGQSGSTGGSSSQITHTGGEKSKGVLKHNRESDDRDDGGRPKRTKRSRVISNEQTPLFACHFRKRDPGRYGNPQSKWYKYCSDPCSSNLRRIK